MPRGIILFTVFALVFITNSISWASDHNVEQDSTLENTKAYQDIPFKQSEAITGSSLVSVAIIFLFAVILAGLVIWFLKKIINEKSIIKFPDTRIKLLEAKRVTPKTTVLLIEVDGNEYLLTQSNEPGNLIRHDAKNASIEHK